MVTGMVAGVGLYGTAAEAMLFSGSGAASPPPDPGTLSATLTLKTKGGGNIAANQIFEFGLPIAPATMPTTDKVVLTDAAASALTVQEDLRIIDADGYVRWVFITSVLEDAPGAPSTDIAITSAAGSPDTSNAITTANLLAQTISADTFEFKGEMALGSAGTAYECKATVALAASTTWTYGDPLFIGYHRQGPLCTEFVVYAPFTAVSGGAPHDYLYREMHIAAYKASGAAWHNTNNPITGTRIYRFDENGFNGNVPGWAGTPQDYVYDIVDKVGASTLSTVLSLTGGSTTGNLTLAATSGNNFAAVRAAGTFALSTSAPNSSDNGKAIVELSGSATGRGYIAECANGSTTAYLVVPTGTPFTGTTVTSWKTVGVYHYYGSRVSNTNPAIGGSWWGTNHDLVYPILTTAYIKASWMVMNFRLTSASLIAPSLTACNRDGAHPCGMSVHSGAMKNYGNNEASTGDADHIGLHTDWEASAVAWWGDATQHANARKLLIYNAEVGHRKPYVFRNEEYGRFNTLADTGIYGTRVDSPILLNDSRAGSGWFTFAGNHSGQTDYVAYLLTGNLYHLQNMYFLSTMYAMQSTNYGIFDRGTVGNGVTCSGTTITGTHSSLPFETGESFTFYASSARPSVGGVGIPYSNRYFWKSLTANTGQAYDTKANALAGGATGRVTFSANGSGVYLVNGHFKQGCTFSGEGQARTIAWNARSIGQPVLLAPDNPITSGACVTTDWQKSNVRRPYNGLMTWMTNLYYLNPNYLAGFKPRYLTIANGTSGGMWQINYVRMTLLNYIEAGGDSYASSPTRTFLYWLSEDAIQWHVEPTIWPPAYCSNYYFVIAETLGSGVTSVSRDFIDCIDNGTGPPWGQVGGYNFSIAYNKFDPTNITATVGSVADPANVTVTFSGNYFDTNNKTPYEGKAWLGTTSGFFGSLTGYGQIKTINSATQCVVDFTVTTSPYTGETINPIVPTAGAGKTLRLPVPPPAVAAANTATVDYYYDGNGAMRNGDVFAIGMLDRSSLEIAKQISCNEENYTAAVAEMTGRNFPTSWSNAFGARSKFNIASRV